MPATPLVSQKVVAWLAAPVEGLAPIDVLLVPNAALRFKPADAAAATSSFASAIVPSRPRRGGQQGQAAARGKGARQTVYILDKGIAKPVAIQTGVSDGSMTEVTGGALQPGMQVITGQLASGGS